MKKLKVLLASSEAVPFAKTGGLADVAGSLPIALEELGVDIRVIMPKYASVKAEADESVMGRNVKVYFVRNDDYYNRKGLYGDRFGDYSDNLDRFVFFSKEIPERCRSERFYPDIIHCNDWQSALVPVYLNTHYKYEPAFARTRTLFTIHNLAYQGLFDKDEFPKIGLDWSLFNVNYFEFYDRVNLMKAGIVYSDAISTVSPTYAGEILTKAFGCGLEGVLKDRENVLSGILNGIDYGVWNPATDTKIFKRYSVDTIDDKYLNKEGLQRELKVKVDREIPMIGLISRLADQKGMDILAKIMDDLLSMKVQLVVLGTGENKYHRLLSKAAKAHPRNTSINLRFDAVLAQKIYAGCDLFLIPSKYEPCGLSQMISFKYGTIPVVRQTGGLADSVKEFEPKTREGTGFAFAKYEPQALFSAIRKALSIYQNGRVWRELVKKVMALDFSWKVSAKEYIRLYEKIMRMGR